MIHIYRWKVLGLYISTGALWISHRSGLLFPMALPCLWTGSRFFLWTPGLIASACNIVASTLPWLQADPHAILASLSYQPSAFGQFLNLSQPNFLSTVRRKRCLGHRAWCDCQEDLLFGPWPLAHTCPPHHPSCSAPHSSESFSIQPQEAGRRNKLEPAVGVEHGRLRAPWLREGSSREQLGSSEERKPKESSSGHRLHQL